MTTRATCNRHGWLAGWLAWAGICGMLLALAPRASFAQSAPGSAADKSAAQLLKEQQAQVVARYKRFEEVLLRMAEVTASDDPQRAALLRQAVARSKKQLIALQFERLMQAMDGERFAVAVNTQNDVTRDLKGLLELLLNEDRSKRLASEQERVREYLKQLNKLIKEQQGVEAQTRRGQQDAEQLADRQDKLADNTGKLGEQVKRDADEARREVGDDAEAEDEANDGEASEANESKSKDSDTKGSGDPRETAESDASDADAKSNGESGESQAGDQKSGDKQSDDAQSEKQQDGQPSDSKSSDGQPSDGKPSDQSQQQGQQSGESGESGEQQDQDPNEQQDRPTDSVQQRLKAAQQRMQQATERLKQAQRNEAADEQRKALEELEQAKAELEKILRQLREEELARVLAMLEARFRKMLAAQKEVYSATTRLAALPDDQRGRSVEIESGRLGRQESQIALEADKALTLLREDGSAVAMPEAVMQLRDDMQQVSQRLNEFKLDGLTVGLEEDIIAGLEDILAALEKAKKDLEQQQQQSPPPSGEPQEPPLVDALAELKMIRALQMRVNRRTQTYSELIDGEQAVQADLLAALEELAQRQERIFRATKDIAIGRNR